MQNSSLVDAIGDFDVDRVKQILANLNTDINRIERGGTPIVWAVTAVDKFADNNDDRNKAIEILKEILKHPKLDVNKKSYEGTALHRADSEDTIKLLLAHPKINVNITNNSHDTPLHKSIQHSNYGVTKTLLADPRIDVTIRNGYTPFEQYMQSRIRTLVDNFIENKKNRRMVAEVATMSGTNAQTRSLPQLPPGVSGNISQFLTTTNPKPPKVSEETMRYQERVAREKQAAEQKQQADKDYRAREAMLLGRDSFPINSTLVSTDFVGNNPRNLGGQKTRRKPISARYSRSVKVRSW